MGGRLTVTSKVNSGSTFTFILPYKVSPICDSSDDPDELADMTDHEASHDDLTAGFFQFQPRTLGSLFSSNGPSRTTQKLLPNSIGFSSSHKLNGFSEDSYSFVSNNVRTKEASSTSPDDACSVAAEATETEMLSEPECSPCHSMESRSENEATRRKQFHIDKNSPVSICNGHAEAKKEVEAEANISNVQNSCRKQEKSEQITLCRPSSSPEAPAETKPKPKPKILLVEDNKINVMVTQSMMKQLGHSIDIVNNGVEAVRAVQKRSYDLVLMVNF